MFRSVALLLLLVGCSARKSDTFSLYRNTALDPAARIHVASFDADESGSTYNKKNCAMAARLYNANVKALNDGNQPAVFWCEAGRYTAEGGGPTNTDGEFPTDTM